MSERTTFISYIDRYGRDSVGFSEEQERALRAGEPVSYEIEDEGKTVVVSIDDATPGRRQRKAAEQAPVDEERKARHAEAVQFIAGYAGRFGLILDLRADRRWGTKHFKLSDRQIEVVLAAKAREEQWAKERAAVTPIETGVIRRASIEVTEGYYLHEGAVYKVQRSKAGRLYATRLDEEAHKFEFVSGAVYRLSPDERMDEEAMAAFGRRTGICGVCSALLTNPESIERGIGPICAGRLG